MPLPHVLPLRANTSTVIVTPSIFGRGQKHTPPTAGQLAGCGKVGRKRWDDWLCQNWFSSAYLLVQGKQVMVMARGALSTSSAADL